MAVDARIVNYSSCQKKPLLGKGGGHVLGLLGRSSLILLALVVCSSVAFGQAQSMDPEFSRLLRTAMDRLEPVRSMTLLAEGRYVHDMYPDTLVTEYSLSALRDDGLRIGCQLSGHVAKGRTVLYDGKRLLEGYPETGKIESFDQARQPEYRLSGVMTGWNLLPLPRNENIMREFLNDSEIYSATVGEGMIHEVPTLILTAKRHKAEGAWEECIAWHLRRSDLLPLRIIHTMDIPAIGHSYVDVRVKTVVVNPMIEDDLFTERSLPDDIVITEAPRPSSTGESIAIKPGKMSPDEIRRVYGLTYGLLLEEYPQLFDLSIQAITYEGKEYKEFIKTVQTLDTSNELSDLFDQYKLVIEYMLVHGAPLLANAFEVHASTAELIDALQHDRQFRSLFFPLVERYLDAKKIRNGLTHHPLRVVSRNEFLETAARFIYPEWQDNTFSIRICIGINGWAGVEGERDIALEAFSFMAVFNKSSEEEMNSLMDEDVIAFLEKQRVEGKSINNLKREELWEYLPTNAHFVELLHKKYHQMHDLLPFLIPEWEKI